MLVEELKFWIPWGYHVLYNIDTIRSSAGDLFFSVVTNLGSEFFYIVLLSVIYWSVDKRIGRSFAFACLLSGYLNLYLKYLIGMPRPDAPEVREMVRRVGGSQFVPVMHEPTPSFPSNHAQGTMVSGIYIANAFRKWWLWLTAFVVIVLVGYSRLYIGVHFPQDVIAGWLIGYVFIRIWILVENPVRDWIGRLPVWVQVTGLVVVPGILISLWSFPEAAKVLGAVSGLGIGFILEGRYVRFDVAGSAGKRILRSVAGLVIVFVVLMILKVLLEPLEGPRGPAGAVVCAVRYMVTGFTVAVGAPWVFIRIKLAGAGK